MTKKNLFIPKTSVKPIGLIFAIDILLTAISFLSSYFICISVWPELHDQSILIQLPIIIATTSLIFLIVGSKRGLVKHDKIGDAYAIFNAICLANILTIILVVVHGKLTTNEENNFLIPASIIVVHSILSCIALIASRFLFTTLHGNILKITDSPSTERIALAGSITSMRELIQAFEKHNSNILVAGFIDLDSNTIIETSSIYSVKKYQLTNTSLVQLNVEKLIIAKNTTLNFNALKLVRKVLSLPIKIKIAEVISKTEIPESIFEIIKIDDFKIGEICNQTQHTCDVSFNRGTAAYYNKKRILVLGAAGCVGMEITKKLFPFEFQKILLIDKSDESLFQLEQELSDYKNRVSKTLRANILDRNRMRQIFRDFSPDIVINAVGYKIFDFTKGNLYEALRLNITANKIVADLSVEFETSKYINLSRNFPTKFCSYTIATKRVGEIYLNCLNTRSSTDFINIRFGNIMESPSSSLNLFKNQLAKGGPIKISSKEAVINFIPVSKLANTIIKISAIGKGGEIFEIETDNSITEFDLANQLIKTSKGTNLNQIDIVMAQNPNINEPICNLISSEVISNKFKKINNLKFLKEEFDNSAHLLKKIDSLCAANLLFDKKIVRSLIEEILKKTFIQDLKHGKQPNSSTEELIENYRNSITV